MIIWDVPRNMLCLLFGRWFHCSHSFHVVVKQHEMRQLINPMTIVYTTEQDRRPSRIAPLRQSSTHHCLCSRPQLWSRSYSHSASQYLQAGSSAQVQVFYQTPEVLQNGSSHIELELSSRWLHLLRQRVL